MKTLKRWTAVISSSFDRVISQVENHEALINSSIREIQASGGRARAQLQRVRRDGQRLRQQLIELRNAKERWSERALREAASDQQQALECLQRHKRIARQIADLEEQERQHANVEKQLAQDLQSIEERLAKLKQQRNIFRTRQSRAEALRLLEGESSSTVGEIDEIFERWEGKLCEFELDGGAERQPLDELDHELSSAEELAELKDELQQLVAAAASRQP